MKVGVTGTREGMTQHQKEQFVLKMYELNPSEFHHGDCVGADAEAHDMVREFFPDVWIVVHPPIKTYSRAYKQGDEYRAPLEYVQRDRNIVDETDFLIGAPLSDVEVWRSGSWTTIRHARKTGKNHEVLKR